MRATGAAARITSRLDRLEAELEQAADNDAEAREVMSAELERGPEARRLALELVVALELGRWPVDVLDPEAVPGELIEVLSLLCLRRRLARSGWGGRPTAVARQGDKPGTRHRALVKLCVAF